MLDPRDDADDQAPRTAAEHRNRAYVLFARARSLPRFCADAFLRAMVDEANTMLLEAGRLDDEEHRLHDLRRVTL